MFLLAQFKSFWVMRTEPLLRFTFTVLAMQREKLSLLTRKRQKNSHTNSHTGTKKGSMWRAPQQKNVSKTSAWDENRTRTALRPRDFKSLASTNSATQAGVC